MLVNLRNVSFPTQSIQKQPNIQKKLYKDVEE